MIRVSAATRQELINKSLRSTKGKQRYYRRLFSKIEYPNRALSRVDVNKWFKEDILDADISVQGETNKYTVTISFYGVWENYEGELSRKSIKDAITKAYRNEDIFIYCTCPDFYYRYSYVATQNGYITKHIQTIPAPIRNPHDSLGSACKHVLLCLFQSHRWITELANNTYKYIQYIKKSNPTMYKNIIAPIVEIDTQQEPMGEDVSDDRTRIEETDEVGDNGGAERTTEDEGA